MNGEGFKFPNVAEVEIKQIMLGSDGTLFIEMDRIDTVKRILLWETDSIFCKTIYLDEEETNESI